jgi:hypothetical protein
MSACRRGPTRHGRPVRPNADAAHVRRGTALVLYFGPLASSEQPWPLPICRTPLSPTMRTAPSPASRPSMDRRAALTASRCSRRPCWPQCRTGAATEPAPTPTRKTSSMRCLVAYLHRSHFRCEQKGGHFWGRIFLYFHEH